MKAYTNIAANIAKVTLISMVFISLTSCGSYQYANRDDDSVYASSRPKERIVYVNRPSKNQSNYFLDQAKQFEDLNNDDVLVDLDSLSTNKKDSINYVSGAPWEYTKDVTVNVYANPYNYYGYGGYYNDFYYDYDNYYLPYYGYPYYNYGYLGYYNPYYYDYGYYYNPSFYIGLGFGYPYYNPYSYYYRPYYYGYYNGYLRAANYHKRNTFNTRGRRGSFTARYNRNFKSNTNRYSANRNNYSKRNSENTYKRNNSSNTYHRNNYNKNNVRYRNNSYKRSGYKRSNYSRSHNQYNYRPSINRSRSSSGAVGRKPVYRRNHVGVTNFKKQNSNAVVAAKNQRKTYGRVYNRNYLNRYNTVKKGESPVNNNRQIRTYRNKTARGKYISPSYKSLNRKTYYRRSNNSKKRSYSTNNRYNSHRTVARTSRTTTSHSNRPKSHKSYRRNH